MSSTDLAYAPTSFRLLGIHFGTMLPIVLRLCYAMSGRTDIVFAMLLRHCYTMSVTDLAHRAISLCTRYAMSGTDVAYAPTRPPLSYALSGTDMSSAMLLRRLSSYAPTMQCTVHVFGYGPTVCTGVVLRLSYGLSGTEVAYGATRGWALLLSNSQLCARTKLGPFLLPSRWGMLLPGIGSGYRVDSTPVPITVIAGPRELRYQRTRVLCDVRTDLAHAARRCPHQVSSAIGLRACYASSSTDTAYGAVVLHTCYAMSGTDPAHGATCLPSVGYGYSIACYGLPTQCPIPA
eukprot:3940745-Rhodomonas_salina.11